MICQVVYIGPCDSGQNDLYDRAGGCRPNLKLSAEFSYPLGYPSQAHTAAGWNQARSFKQLWRNTFSIIPDRQQKLVAFFTDMDVRSVTAGMPMHVGQTLLHDPKYGDLDLLRKPLQIRRDVQIYRHMIALHESIDIPLQG